MHIKQANLFLVPWGIDSLKGAASAGTDEIAVDLAVLLHNGRLLDLAPEAGFRHVVRPAGLRRVAMAHGQRGALVTDVGNVVVARRVHSPELVAHKALLGRDSSIITQDGCVFESTNKRSANQRLQQTLVSQ